jgi:hypothetical protein
LGQSRPHNDKVSEVRSGDVAVVSFGTLHGVRIAFGEKWSTEI